MTPGCPQASAGSGGFNSYWGGKKLLSVTAGSDDVTGGFNSSNKRMLMGVESTTSVNKAQQWGGGWSGAQSQAQAQAGSWGGGRGGWSGAQVKLCNSLYFTPCVQQMANHNCQKVHMRNFSNPFTSLLRLRLAAED